MKLFETNDREIYDFTDDDRKDIGKRIKRVREARGLNQSDVANVLGHKDTNRISRAEGGKGTLDILTLMGIHQILEVPLVYLLYGIDFDFPELSRDDYPDSEKSLARERERTEKQLVIVPILDEVFGIPLNEVKNNDPD